MTLKEIFKTVEGIIVLAAFVAIILTGAKVFAWAGLAAYTIVNLRGGLNKAKAIIMAIVNFVKNLIKSDK